MEIRRKLAVIGGQLKIVGNVLADGLALQLNGQIEGEVYCALLIVASTARLVGKITAEKVVVRGSVEGPIFAEELLLAADAHVKGDINCQTVVIEKGGYLEGRISHRSAKNGEAQPTGLPAQRERRRRDSQHQTSIDGRGRHVQEWR
jgi:cytoskeletal protein CcmA (bactofilin family)